jgi:hypothetical protein
MIRPVLILGWLCRTRALSIFPETSSLELADQVRSKLQFWGENFREGSGRAITARSPDALPR